MGENLPRGGLPRFASPSVEPLTVGGQAIFHTYDIKFVNTDILYTTFHQINMKLWRIYDINLYFGLQKQLWLT